MLVSKCEGKEDYSLKSTVLRLA